jgi:release factor glutamine methyltransferase
MRKHFKHLASIILIPFTQWYLRKERTFSYNNITITIRPNVFHPGLFYSTKFLLSYLQGKQLEGKRFLELGCGTGLISIVAAKQKAIVTASDISDIAIENCKSNVQRNNASVSIIESDLFTTIPSQTFDWIVINPPYYARDPKSEADYAWYCGSNFEYFENLFEQLPSFSNDETTIIMVLTKGCDLDSIFAIAKKNNYSLNLIQEKEVLFDGKDYLFEIKPANSSRVNPA